MSDTKHLSVHSEEGQAALTNTVDSIQAQIDHRNYGQAQIVALAALINAVSVVASQLERIGDLLEARNETR